MACAQESRRKNWNEPNRAFTSARDQAIRPPSVAAELVLASKLAPTGFPNKGGKGRKVEGGPQRPHKVQRGSSKHKVQNKVQNQTGDHQISDDRPLTY